MMFDLLCVTYFINKTSKFVLLFGRIHDTHTHTLARCHRYCFFATHTYTETTYPKPIPNSQHMPAAALHVCATRSTAALALVNPPSGDGQRWLAARLCRVGHTHHRAGFGLFGPLAPAAPAAVAAKVGCVRQCWGWLNYRQVFYA